MRALLLVAASLFAATPDFATAQVKLSTKPDPNAVEVRYFTAIDGLMDGNADVILKETRQGKAVTSAVLDVCYPAEKGSDRKDRFVANLAVNGQTLTGALAAPSQLVQLTEHQGADGHCGGLGQEIWSEVVYPWLRNTLLSAPTAMTS